MSSNAVFRMIFLVFFLGWLIIWIMLPTKLYKNTWTPKLESKLTSTYFGGQGTNLLLFSFPVMFIAAFACTYLHFQNKSSDYRVTALLKRPVLVMAPLGIVSALELVFAAMFVALMIWSLANYLYVSFGHLHMHKEGKLPCLLFSVNCLKVLLSNSCSTYKLAPSNLFTS